MMLNIFQNYKFRANSLRSENIEKIISSVVGEDTYKNDNDFKYMKFEFELLLLHTFENMLTFSLKRKDSESEHLGDDL